MCYNCMTLKTIAKEIYFIRRILRLQYFPLTNGQDTWNGILNIDCRHDNNPTKLPRQIFSR